MAKRCEKPTEAAKYFFGATGSIDITESEIVISLMKPTLKSFELMKQKSFFTPAAGTISAGFFP